jgi:hypothetical protein
VTRKRRPPFDPLGLLATLERQRVAYVVIGGLARVIQGTDEVTRGVDIVPSTRPDNLRKLSAALDELGAGNVEVSTAEPVSVRTSRGELRVVPLPTGTRGYDDLRRAATREPLGQGLRPAVASKGDLARMLSALGRDEDAEKLRQLRRLIELERELGVGLGV